MGLKNILFLNIWDTESLECCPFYVLQGLREEKNEYIPKYTRQNIYIYIYIFIKVFAAENMLFFIREFIEVFYFPSAFIGMI